jgi:hypothetical protein
MKVGWEAVWEAAKMLHTEFIGISWNGFHVAGDKKSIDEVRRLMHLEERLRWFERHHKECNLEAVP